MIRVLGLGAFLALASGVRGDSIILSNTAALVNIPVSISNPGPGTGCGLTSNCGSLGTGPYWDNRSGDGPDMNAGFFLTGTCGVSGDCNTNYDPLQYLSQNNGSGQPDAPTNIALDHTSSSAVVTLLGTYTSDATLIFGYYDTTTMAETPILGPGSLTSVVGYSAFLSIASGDDYGFYLTRACYSSIASCSGGYTTWFSNSSLDTTDVGHQHFAIFDSPTTALYYIVVEDWTNGGLEGYGDFNDIVFQLNTSVPEPAAFVLIGAGLAALGLARLRARKKWDNR